MSKPTWSLDYKKHHLIFVWPLQRDHGPHQNKKSARRTEQKTSDIQYRDGSKPHYLVRDALSNEKDSQAIYQKGDKRTGHPPE